MKRLLLLFHISIQWETLTYLHTDKDERKKTHAHLSSTRISQTECGRSTFDFERKSVSAVDLICACNIRNHCFCCCCFCRCRRLAFLFLAMEKLSPKILWVLLFTRWIVQLLRAISYIYWFLYASTFLSSGWKIQREKIYHFYLFMYAHMWKSSLNYVNENLKHCFLCKISIHLFEPSILISHLNFDRVIYGIIDIEHIYYVSFIWINIDCIIIRLVIVREGHCIQYIPFYFSSLSWTIQLFAQTLHIVIKQKSNRSTGS